MIFLAYMSGLMVGMVAGALLYVALEAYLTEQLRKMYANQWGN